MLSLTFKVVISSIRWYWKIFGQIFKKQKLVVIKDISFELINEVLGLLTFVLPIKVIVLLGSESIPKYIQILPDSFNKAETVIVLSVVAVCSFFCNLLITKHLANSSKSFSYAFLKANENLKWGDAEFTRYIYNKYTASISKILFSALIIALICMVYPLVFQVFISLLLMAILFFLIRISMSQNFKLRMFHDINQYMKTTSAVLFLILFASIIFDFLYPLSPPSLIIAIISLILARQALAGLSFNVQSIFLLAQKKAKVNGVIYKGYGKSMGKLQQTDVLWNIALSDERDLMFHKVLQNIVDFNIQKVSSAWFQLSTPNVLCFKVECSDKQGEVNYFLVKLYPQRNTKLAQREEVLFEQLSEKGIVHNLSFITKIDNITTHIFQFDTDLSAVNNAQADIYNRILSIEFDNQFLSQYSSAHSFLWERIDDTIISKLILGVSSVEDHNQLSKFKNDIIKLQDILSSLPLKVVLSSAVLKDLIADKNGKLGLISLGNWSIEPLGYGWPLNPKQRKSFFNNENDYLESSVFLCSILAELENNISKASLFKSIDLIYKVNELLTLPEYNLSK
ncbi:hypothetical protein AADZ91_01830 [Colwelliaceae bacterium 6441]